MTPWSSHAMNVLSATTMVLLFFDWLLPFHVSASNTCDASSNASCRSSSRSCSDAADLRYRIAHALDPNDGHSLTDVGESLRATLDDVLSRDECQFLVDRLPASAFVAAGGYETTSNQYTAQRKGYSGIGLAELSQEKAVFSSQADYQTFLELREKVRVRTERALNLCEGSLAIEYTHVSQKTEGGSHHPHADNAFHTYKIRNGVEVAIIDPARVHPYANRIAASILYLNDEGFEGGEFYWARRTLAASEETAAPETLVEPRTGRMTVFTSGIENLHGALPVRDPSATGNEPQGRRLALALWYVVKGDPSEEQVPAYGATPAAEEGTEEEDDPHRTPLFSIPVRSMANAYSLQRKLGLFLLGKQHSPRRNAWKASGGDGSSRHPTLYMVFGDQTAMVSIVLKATTIVVSRHTDGVKPASLMYQLQESVFLHSLLTELEKVVAEAPPQGAIVELDQADIDAARKKLPTR